MEKTNVRKGNSIDRQYKELLEHILHFGVDKQDRTGTGTKSIFGWQIRHNMKEGFPLLTTKKMAWKTMVTELLWFLRGDTSIEYLLENDCNIWTGDAYKRYWDAHPDAEKLFQYEGHNMEVRRMTKDEFVNMIKTDDEFAKTWGELGKIYGYQWRNWNDSIDQISELIKQLKENPDSRRLLVSAWNASDLPHQVLPPCHYGFQVYTRELSLNERGEVFKKTYPDKSVSDFAPGGMEVQSLGHQLTTRYNNAKIPTRAISLMWNQRSVDTFLGLPFNIASYALLLEIIAKQVNMIPDELIGNLGDVHLYKNHIEQAEEQITRTPFELPKLIINSGNENWHLLEVDEIINTFDVDITFKVENYQSHPAIKAPLSN